MNTMPEKFIDPCEYNPTTGKAASNDEVHAEAAWLVGAQGEWRLCDACAALPRFKRYRIRMKIKRKTENQ